jgi:hypothetical protein
MRSRHTLSVLVLVGTLIAAATTPAAAAPPDSLAIFSYAGVTLTSDDVWECPDGTTASAYIETGFVIGDVLKVPINAGKPGTWMDADIWSIVVDGCGSDRFEFGPAFSYDLTGQFTTDEMAMETYDWAVLDIGPIPYYQDWVFTGVLATFDLAWQATGKPTTVHGTEFLGADRNAPASVTGTVTVHGLPAWHSGWDGSITFVADPSTEAWLGREVQVAR